MESNVELSIIIPAYKEGENLKILLPRLITTLNSLNMTYEVLIVDQITSTDDTQAVCKENNVIYLNREGDNYYCSAVKTGIKNAQGKYILFMDGDGSHDPEFIPKLVLESKENDIVIASRYIDGGATENPKSLIFLSWFVNRLYAIILNIHCKDVSNSFKLYKSELLKELTLKSQNFDIIEEILYKICKTHKDIKIKEIPFLFKKRMFGTSKRNFFVFIISYVFTLLRLRFGK